MFAKTVPTAGADGVGVGVGVGVLEGTEVVWTTLDRVAAVEGSEGLAAFFDVDPPQAASRHSAVELAAMAAMTRRISRIRFPLDSSLNASCIQAVADYETIRIHRSGLTRLRACRSTRSSRMSSPSSQNSTCGRTSPWDCAASTAPRALRREHCAASTEDTRIRLRSADCPCCIARGRQLLRACVPG